MMFRNCLNLFPATTTTAGSRRDMVAGGGGMFSFSKNARNGCWVYLSSYWGFRIVLSIK